MELLLRGQQFNPTDAALYQARALIQWQDLNKPENARALFRAGVRADASHLPLWQAWGCMEAALVSERTRAHKRHVYHLMHTRTKNPNK